MSGAKYQIRNEAPRCFDLYVKTVNRETFRYVNTYGSLAEAKNVIDTINA